MNTCNTVFWSVVVPTVIYGCELWLLNDKSLDLLEVFQNYVGKRIQRLHPRCPNVCSFYSLGWMRLERLIQIRKISFVRSIMVLPDDAVPKIIFCKRARVYFLNRRILDENPSQSNTFDLLKTCEIFGLIENVKNMVENGHFYPKAMWKNIIWKRGWELENTYWSIERCLHKSLDILSGINNGNMYSTWWKLSDKFPEEMRKCEVIMKIICHSSKLRADDLKLKDSTLTHRMCSLCDNFQEENARHLLLQCPYFHDDRNRMLVEIGKIEGVGVALNESRLDVFHTILGGPVIGLNERQEEKLRRTTLNYVHQIYQTSSRHKAGIG